MINSCPQLVVQYDWQDVFNLRQNTSALEKIWIGVKQVATPSVYCDLLIDDLPVLAPSNFNVSDPLFTARYLKSGKLEICCESPKFESIFVPPSDCFSEIHQKSIDCIDVANTGLGVSSSTDGNMFVWESNSGQKMRDLNGHVGDVYACKLFPSGMVVLSGGSDMMLKIWSAESGECVRTMVGHTRAILDVAMIEKGKNVISCSRDGSCRIWDCPTGNQIGIIIPELGQINAVAVGSFDYAGESINKLAIMSCEKDNSICGYSVDSCENPVFTLKHESPVNCLAFFDDTKVVAGCDKGELAVWDLRNPKHVLTGRKDTRGNILSVCCHSDRIFASTADGTAFDVQFKNGQFDYSKVVELSGVDIDPINKMVLVDKRVFTCSRDSNIRCYNL